MPLRAHVLANIAVAINHAGTTVLASSFDPVVAVDRAERAALAFTSRADPSAQSIEVFVAQGTYDWSASGYCHPHGLPTGAIAFTGYYWGGTGSRGLTDNDTAIRALAHRRLWCIFDVYIADPTRIIPATLMDPYRGRPGRRELELKKTEMVPLWFWQTDRSLGIHITARDHTCLPDTPTRIRGTSLKVGLWWRNYERLEKQIQLRTRAQMSTSHRPYISYRQLARRICKAVQNAMAEYEMGDIRSGRTEWQDPRWRIGPDPTCITVRNVILLGIIYVSPGRVMPLLRI